MYHQYLQIIYMLLYGDTPCLDTVQLTESFSEINKTQNQYNSLDTENNFIWYELAEVEILIFAADDVLNV